MTCNWAWRVPVAIIRKMKERNIAFYRTQGGPKLKACPSQFPERHFDRALLLAPASTAVFRKWPAAMRHRALKLSQWRFAG